ncbi:MAG: class I SAM-dependent methyltransferase [Haloechinothrix sp.]
MRDHRIFATFYDRMVASMEREIFGPRRAKLLGELTGDVLDVGAGTGANLVHFGAADRVVAAEPDRAMRARLLRKLNGARVPVEVSDAGAEQLPFAGGSFDSVVFTLVLCTIPDPDGALSEARRVLKPGGRILVLEHVRAADRALARWQDRITPLWRWVGAGCHPNRDTRASIEQAGFRFTSVEEFQPIPKWIPTSPMLQAVAVRQNRGSHG